MKSITFLAGVLSLLAAAPTASAYGINCRGNNYCFGSPEFGRPDWMPGKAGPFEQHSVQLARYIASLNDTTFIPTDALIGCTRNICAYLSQIPPELGGLYAGTVKHMAQDIVEHGCERCGKRALLWTPEEADGGLGKKKVWDAGFLEFDHVHPGRRRGNENGYNDYACGRVLSGLCPNFCKLVDGCVYPTRGPPDWSQWPNAKIPPNPFTKNETSEGEQNGP